MENKAKKDEASAAETMADSARRRKKPRRLMMKLKQLWLTKKAR